jgi:hypothetical protein
METVFEVAGFSCAEARQGKSVNKTRIKNATRKERFLVRNMCLTPFCSVLGLGILIGYFLL